MGQHDFRIKEEGGKQWVFDRVRKKYVVLTPEEWVRQQILQYMIEVLLYPAALISVEKQILVGSRRRRYDIVVYKEDMPWLIVECKSEKEALNDAVLSQLLAYNSSLRVAFLAITNGREVHAYQIDKRSWESRLPVYIP